MQSRWVAVLILPFLLIWYGQLVSYSDGPPTGRTGAPGELTCYNGSCHNSFPLNSGPGEAVILANIPEAGYVPDSIYTLETRVQHSGMGRFGFQLIAYSPESQGSAGILLTLEDSAGLTVVPDNDRQYILHYDATEATDSTRWRFLWQAPAAASGPVVFYAAFVASNNNGNRQGDYVYTTSQGITADPLTTGTNPGHSLQGLRMVSDTDRLLLHMELQKPLRLETKILDLAGKTVYTSKEVAPAGYYQSNIPTAGWSAGIYVLTIRSEYGHVTRKLMIR